MGCYLTTFQTVQLLGQVINEQKWIKQSSNKDGAPPHFANPVKRLLNDNLHGRWIGRGTRHEHRHPSPLQTAQQQVPDPKTSSTFYNTDIIRKGVPEATCLNSERPTEEVRSMNRNGK
ncbi:hypothetical protein J6590_026285 [Homalodisca vitripennis]|nr:hypothetical protein J6590_026285 [Homalodisca vitripennis]